MLLEEEETPVRFGCNCDEISSIQSQRYMEAGGSGLFVFVIDDP